MGASARWRWLIYTAVTGVALLVAFMALVLEALAGWRATLVLPVLTGVAGSYLAWRHVPESRARERVLRRAATAAAWALTFLPADVGLRLRPPTRGPGTTRCR